MSPGWPQQVWRCRTVLLRIQPQKHRPAAGLAVGRGRRAGSLLITHLAGVKNFFSLVTEMPCNKSVNRRACCRCEFYLVFASNFATRLQSNFNCKGPLPVARPNRPPPSAHAARGLLGAGFGELLLLRIPSLLARPLRGPLGVAAGGSCVRRPPRPTC